MLVLDMRVECLPRGGAQELIILRVGGGQLIFRVRRGKAQAFLHRGY